MTRQVRGMLQTFTIANKRTAWLKLFSLATLYLDTPWLVVFDNADRDFYGNDDNLALLQDFWPASLRGSILITSQDKRVPAQYAEEHNEELKPWPEADSLEFLYRATGTARSPENEVLARQIVERFDNFPHFLHHAANRIKIESLTFSNFQQIYPDNREFIKDSQPIHSPAPRYPHSPSTVWSLPFEGLDDKARAMMNIVSFFDQDFIREDHLQQGTSESGLQSLSFLCKEPNFIKCRAKLTESSLVSWNKDLRVLWIHRNVREICHLRMKPEERQTAFEQACDIIYTIFPQQPLHARRQHTILQDQETKINHVVSFANLYRSSLRNKAAGNFASELRPSTMFAELLFLGAW